MFVSRMPWRKLEREPVIVSVGDVNIRVGYDKGSVRLTIDAPEGVQITRSGAQATAPAALEPPGD